MRNGTLCAIAFFMAATAAAQNNAVVNGGFEDNGGVATSMFTGWTVFDQKNGSGSWYVQKGTTPVPSNVDCATVYVVPVPPGGSYVAMTNMSDAGTHILYQDVQVPNAASVSLSFDLYFRSRVPFSPKQSLDFHTAHNQQFRVDLLDVAASIMDVGSGVLQNIYLTKATDDPEGFGGVYKTLTYDISSFAGRTVRLRFAETDNDECLVVGLDNVTIKSNACATEAPRAINFAFSGIQGCSTSKPCLIGEEIAFTPAANGYTFASCDVFAWDFGDGNTAAGFSPTHRYAQPGTYTAKVTVTNPVGSGASGGVVINVVAPPPRRRSAGH